MQGEFVAENTIVLLGLVFIGIALVECITGDTSLRMRRIRRAEQPWLFWGAVILHSVAGAALILVRVMAI